MREVDLGALGDVEAISLIACHVGDGTAPAYFNNLQLATTSPAVSSFDVQVARDAAFTDLVHNETSVPPPYAATNLSGDTTCF